MGGTSYDVCLVQNGAPEVRSGWNWHHRYLVGLPMVDVETVGAGGGSIARVESGALKVGPRSAGAEPGPVCYGRGGVEPTVTDANVVLGYLNPDRFCGGTMRLDAESAHAAIAERVARPLGLSVLEAADGIFRLVNANMANAVRKATARRGIDPRTLTLVAYGGNGPVHAGMQAAELGIGRVLVPKLSPAFSALGLLLTDHVVDEMRSYVAPVGQVDLARANRLLEAMEESAVAALAGGGRARRLRVERLAALCYPGQTFDMAVPLPERRGPLTARGLAATIERFHRMHEELHTYASRDQEPILRGAAPEGRRRGPQARAAARATAAWRRRAPRRPPGVLWRTRHGDAGVGRLAARGGAGDRGARDRGGAVHHDRGLSRAARDGGSVRQLRPHAEVSGRVHGARRPRDPGGVGCVRDARLFPPGAGSRLHHAATCIEPASTRSPREPRGRVLEVAAADAGNACALACARVRGLRARAVSRHAGGRAAARRRAGRDGRARPRHRGDSAVSRRRRSTACCATPPSITSGTRSRASGRWPGSPPRRAAWSSPSRTMVG